MSDMFKYIVPMVLAGAGFAALQTVPSRPASASTGPDSKVTSPRAEGLTVSGTVTVKTAPTLALIRLGIGHTDESAEKATSGTREKVEALRKVMKSMGVEDGDFNLEMEHLFDTRRSTSASLGRGWNQTVYVTVIVRDVEKAPEVLDVALASGASSLSSFNYGVEDPAKYWAQARKAAAELAKMKANQHAENLGLKLGAITYVREQIPGDWDNSEHNAMDQRDDGRLTEDDVREQVIGKGSLSFIVKLNVTYSLK